MITNLKELLVHEIQDLYSAECQLEEALPEMETAAKNENLKKAFNDHLQQTKNHKRRLQQAAEKLSASPEGVTCEGMKGLIKESREAASLPADAVVKDAAVIAAAQRVEHYEMAGYGSAVTFAQCLGENEVEKLLLETLEQEKAADAKLNELAKGNFMQSGINEAAARN